MAAAKKKPFFKRVRTKIKKAVRKRLNKVEKYVSYKWILPRVYKKSAREPVDEKLVLFADHRDRDMPDNFRGLYAMCEANGYQCVFHSGQQYSKTLPHWRWKKRKYEVEFMRLYARCRCLFLYEYFPLADIMKPREGTDVVQLWHGCGLMKRMGYAAVGKNWGMSQKALSRYPMHTGYTLVSISSPYLCDGYQEAFQCDPEIIKSLGCPRTDIYFDEKFKEQARQKLRDMIPDIGDRKVILYAPTFRGTTVVRSSFTPKLDYKELKDALADRYVLLTKFHPLMAKGGLSEKARLQGYGFVHNVTHELTPEEALCAADVLITDYSSIAFEYLLLERPVVSYIYDLNQYIKDRGLFAPYDQLLPGPYVFTQEELEEKLLTVDEWFDVGRLRKYREQYMSACDGHSTERIYRYIFETKA